MNQQSYFTHDGGGELKTRLANFLTNPLTSFSDTQCIGWPGAHSTDGYPQVWIKPTVHYVTRLVTAHYYGPPPTPKHHAAHKPVVCHNRGCINPLHLRWATAKQNVNDQELDGTKYIQPRKLTDDDVRSIRADQRLQREIAEDYGIHQVYVSQLKRRIYRGSA
jgi:hypothetical protein